MNQENYKSAMKQIHASEALKTKTLQKIQRTSKRKSAYSVFLAACAMVIVVFLSGVIYYQGNKQKYIITPNISEPSSIAKKEDNLPRLKHIEQLREILKEQYDNTSRFDMNGLKATADLATTQTESIQSAEEKMKEDQYSHTNVQVENVDEADIVKTDGDNIYYVQNNKVYIIKADTLEIVSKVEVTKENERFVVSEIYINDNKLILLGNGYEYQESRSHYTSEEITTDRDRIISNSMAKAYVFDITQKESPNLIREVGIDGYYTQSRMIGENIYFISNKIPNYYEGIKNEDMLPVLKDTAVADETKTIDCTDIIYFENTNNYQYRIVAGFNVNNKEEVHTETFFGASDTIYVSENHLYMTQIEFTRECNTIYKFILEDSKITLQCKGEVKGYIKNQFSLDEYEGNLRIATTSEGDDVTTNQLIILDENLKEIGQIKNLAEGEKIYAVRFMGEVGYIVTFEQIDPLFVIDLSDPTHPVVKGALKIPGYSSYLHPYDETHIIGIGYNTQSNGQGGVKNDNMKMSMFDVSDRENPREIFHINIGDAYTYSEMINNHKALFYHQEEKLIGFPITIHKNYQNDQQGLVIYRINLQENRFEEYGKILQDANYKTNIMRAIYIGETLYTFSNTKVTSYQLNTIEKIKEIEID